MRRAAAATQLALWVGRKGRGSAHLRWAGRELVLFVTGLQVVGVQGDDQGRLEAAFGLTSGGEWFVDASAAVASGQVTQAEANAVIKRVLAETVAEFLRAADATVSFDSRPLAEPEGLTISYPHLIMELVLAGDGDELVPVFLSDPSLVMRRLPDFPKRVGALGLTDEAMAIFAKINDQRSAQEIADPSPHGRDLAVRLLAAAVGAGLVEASPRVAEMPLAMEAVEEEPSHRRLWLWVLLAVALIAVVVALVLTQPWKSARAAGTGGPWGVAVDMGCQSTEMERLYRKQNQDRDNFRLVRTPNGDQTCYRLVWGHFRDRESAERAARSLPDGVLTRGFGPHAVLAESNSP
jgi:hypothetical protein